MHPDSFKPVNQQDMHNIIIKWVCVAQASTAMVMFLILKETNLFRNRSLTKQALRPRVEINQSRLMQTLLWHWALIITRHNGNSRRIAVVIPITTGFGYRFPSLWVIFMMVMVVMMVVVVVVMLIRLQAPILILTILNSTPYLFVSLGDLFRSWFSSRKLQIQPCPS